MDFRIKKLLLIILISNLFFPFIAKAEDPWIGLKNIAINNKEDYKTYCSATQAVGNQRLLRCNINVHDPKGAVTAFQFDTIKKEYSNYTLVNDRRNDIDIQLKLNYSPNNDNYSLDNLNFFYKEDKANKSEYGEASCTIVTHCCCASIKDATGKVTGVDEKNCKQTFCECGSNQRDISLCGTKPKSVPINGSTTDNVISCGANKCTKTDKGCTKNDECTVYGGTGICKNGFCFLDDIALKEYNSDGTTDIVKDLQIRQPILAITIPQLTFTDVENTVDDEGYIYIPYLGEYISAVYKFGMIIISIIAAVMIILYGAKMIVGGGEEKVTGLKKIGQVMIGLFIAWGSYAILYNINPDLVNFKALKVKYIERDEIPFGDNTMDESTDSTGTTGFSEKFSGCPVKMSSEPITKIGKNNKTIPDPAGNESRKQEFVQKILDNKILTGDFSNRAMLAAEAAYKCKIYFGTCGQGTSAIYALAGVNGSFGLDNKCLKQKCNLGADKVIKKKTVHSVYSTKIGGIGVAKLTQGMMCAGIPVCKGAGWAVNWKEPCFTDPKAASNKLKEMLKATGQWDEEQWFNDLKPGDYYDIANWNTTCSPTHSAMFLGWKDKTNHVAFEAGGDAGNFFHLSTRDFDKKGTVIIMIQRPQDK